MKLWISTPKGEQKARQQLEDIGIKVDLCHLEPDTGTICFEPCEVNDESLKKLDVMWPHFIWGPSNFGKK